ncbi:MAG: type IV pilus assembly protein PilM [bacterium]
MGIIPKMNKEIVGLDIGTHSIKIICLRADSLLNIGVAEISNEAISGLSAEARDNLLINTLKRVLSGNKVTAQNSVSSVAGDGVIVRYITLPKMTEKELSATIKFEAEPHVSFDIEQVILDYQIIGEKLEEDLKKMDVILVAAKKDTITRHLSFLESAGLSPVVIDVDAFALENAYEFSHPEDAGGSVALVNIGATFTNVNILEDGISRFTRDILIAGNNFTKVIQRDMRVDYQKAEAMKREKATVMLEEERGSLSVDDEDVAHVSEAIRGPVNELLAELQRSFDYYQAQTQERSIKKCILSGGSAKLKNIDKFLSHELKVSVEIDNPLARLEIDPQVYSPEYIKNVAPLFSVALGLAVRRGK